MDRWTLIGHVSSDLGSSSFEFEWYTLLVHLITSFQFTIGLNKSRWTNKWTSSSLSLTQSWSLLVFLVVFEFGKFLQVKVEFKRRVLPRKFGTLGVLSDKLINPTSKMNERFEKILTPIKQNYFWLSLCPVYSPNCMKSSILLGNSIV